MTLRNVIDYAKKTNPDLAKKVKQKEDEYKDKVIEEHLAAKKKAQDLDRDKIQPKLAAGILGLCLRQTYKDPFLQVKGLVYDNFPKNVSQVKSFLYKLTAEEYHNEEAVNSINIKEVTLTKRKLPHVVINLKCNRELCQQRHRAMMTEHPDTYFFTDLDFERRMTEHEQHSQKTIAFYKELNAVHGCDIRILDVDVSQKSPEEIFRVGREAVFHAYKFLDFLYVSEGNEKELIEKLQTQEEQRVKDEEAQA